MINLQKLNASRNCGIDNDGIKGLNLIELYVSNNPKITNVNWMKKIQKLDASGDCGEIKNRMRFLTQPAALRTRYK